MPHNIQFILTHDKTPLQAALGLDIGTARIEVQCLLQHVLNVSRAWLLAHPERCLDDHEQDRFDELLRRRLSGEPIAYILGEREFYGLTFKVTPDTLIPRPETELLVDLALLRITQTPPSPQPSCVGRGGLLRVLDLGTGSGAIALAIAHARPAAEVLACDLSPSALEVARSNAQRLGIANAAFLQSGWFAALGNRRFDLIVSNPPYIAAGDPHLQQGDVRFEPPSALVSGAEGLEDIRCIVAGAPAHLEPGGWLLLEHGYDQAVKVRELLRQSSFSEVFSAPDLAGIERVSGGRVFA